jgi:pimeloyl-ACP methyl ester carboxylesterase
MSDHDRQRLITRPARALARALGTEAERVRSLIELGSWPVVKDAFPDEVRAEYIKKFSDPETAHAICEEYRAFVTLDYEHDEKDRGNRKIVCPVLFLWGRRGSVAPLYEDPLSIWREWADDVRGESIPVGHFIPEEAPEETTRRLLDFLA